MLKEQPKVVKNAFEEAICNLQSKIDGFVFPLILPPFMNINEDVLFDVFGNLRKMGKVKDLHVLIYSYGGDAHTAFHIGRLLQKFATGKLIIYILREAKSAATLISCAANTIIFTDISELGPMDPQITNKTTKESYSPLAIKHTMELLSEESKLDHKVLVEILSGKLPGPLVLGEHLKSLDTAKDYIYKLLTGRMFTDKKDSEIARTIANKLVLGYPDHGYCIDYLEAKEIGLKVEEAGEDISDKLWNVMKVYKRIWDEFLRIMKDNKDSGEKDSAIKLLTDLQDAVDKLIEKQLTVKKVSGTEKK